MALLIAANLTAQSTAASRTVRSKSPIGPSYLEHLDMMLQSSAGRLIRVSGRLVIGSIYKGVSLACDVQASWMGAVEKYQLYL